jgi:hypothetical protein
MPAVVSLENPKYSQNPVAYAFTLTGTSMQVLKFNALRERVIFHNPHATANVGLCCLVDQNGNPLAARVNGAGSILMLPLTTFDLTTSPSSGWNAITDTPGSGFTILEFF